jgi:hypothetical protein
MPYSAHHSAHRVKTANTRRTYSIVKILHRYSVVCLALLYVPSFLCVPSSVPSLSTYYIRVCLVCLVVPEIACVREDESIGAHDGIIRGHSEPAPYVREQMGQLDQGGDVRRATNSGAERLNTLMRVGSMTEQTDPSAQPRERSKG